MRFENDGPRHITNAVSAGDGKKEGGRMFDLKYHHLVIFAASHEFERPNERLLFQLCLLCPTAQIN